MPFRVKKQEENPIYRKETALIVYLLTHLLAIVYIRTYITNNS